MDGPTVVGLGSDLVEVARFRRAVKRRPSLSDRLFSAAEQEYAHQQKDPAKSLAARFAAKEAVMKALGVGLWKFAFRDVEVVRADSGAPAIKLTGRARELATERNVTSWHLSLTHTEDNALAVVLAIGSAD